MNFEYSGLIFRLGVVELWDQKITHLHTNQCHQVQKIPEKN
jgi:hypothetical protein